MKSDGTSNTTEPMLYNVGHYTSTIPYSIKSKIADACNEYRDLIDTWEGSTYLSYEEGRDIMIRFTGVKGDIP